MTGRAPFFTNQEVGAYVAARFALRKPRNAIGLKCLPLAAKGIPLRPAHFILACRQEIGK
jgi:hypothetical protein